MAKTATPRTTTTASERLTRSPRSPRRKTAHTTSSIAAIEIERRAYELFVARGCEHGHDLDDWFRAEQELTERRG